MSNNTQEIRELRDIGNSRALKNLLKKREGYWQREVNKFVRDKDLTAAYGALARRDDIEKFLGVIKKQIEDLEKEDKNGKD